MDFINELVDREVAFNAMRGDKQVKPRGPANRERGRGRPHVWIEYCFKKGTPDAQAKWDAFNKAFAKKAGKSVEWVGSGSGMVCADFSVYAKDPAKVKAIVKEIAKKLKMKVTAKLSGYENDWERAGTRSKKTTKRSAKTTKKKAKKASSDKPLKGLAFVFTGKMAYFAREEAQKLARKAGAKTPNAIKKGVSYLVVGDDGSPNYKGEGQKKTRAEELGVKVISEKQFLKMLGIKAGKF